MAAGDAGAAKGRLLALGSTEGKVIVAVAHLIPPDVLSVGGEVLTVVAVVYVASILARLGRERGRRGR